METVFVTGAARGIGRAIAIECAKRGWNVVVHYRSSKEEAEATLLEVKRHSNGILVQADLNVEDEVISALKDARAYFGKITMLVNNAGICQEKMFCDVTPSEFDEVMHTNFRSAVFLTQKVLPDMLALGRGAVVNVSSVWGLRGASMESVYSASKFALRGWTEALALEYAPSSIRFNCVAPGCIDTDMMADYTEAERQDLIERTPLHRIGTSEDVASGVAFLLSPESSFITGQTLTIDGGFLM